MKKTFLIVILLISISYYVFPQSTQNFSYQAVVRDASGVVIANQAVGIRIDILIASSDGEVVYTEDHSVTTNLFGLVNLEVGAGTVIAGNFSTINWGANIYFIQISLDPAGGSSYQLMGVSQLLAVPYSLYSQSSGDGALWEQNGNDIYYDSGNVGVGTVTPIGRLQVISDPEAETDDVIFSVLNASGDTVFAVYQEGVRIWVDDNEGGKASGSKGGFAVGGFSSAKSEITNEYLRVTPDSVRVYIDDDYDGSKASGSKGGFAVGGFSTSKGVPTDSYLFVQDDSSRVWTHGDGGFRIMDLESGSANYLDLTPGNYFIGHESGDSITTGLYNSFMGYQAGISTKTSDDNVFIGYKSGYLNDSGGENVYIGKEAGYSNPIGTGNSFIGYRAGYLSTSGQNNVANGSEALYSNYYGSNNVAIGTQALYSNSTGQENTASGYQALYSNETGTRNVGTGHKALYTNTGGGSNVAIGYSSLYLNTTGNNNVAVGYGTLFVNSTGSNNTALGNNCFTSGSAYTNSTAVGANSNPNASNKIRFGNTSVTVIEGQVAYSFPSDGRFKNNIREEVTGLDFITRLRPVVFNFDTKKFDEFLLQDTPDSLKQVMMRNTDYEESSSVLQSGFIAQEVQEAARESGYDFNGIHVPADDRDNYSIAYSLLTVPLVKAVQEQQEQIEELKDINAELLKRIKKIEEQVKE